MHDFIRPQSLSFTGEPRPVARHSVPEWVQCGLMRSFGEDNIAAYRPSPKSPDQLGRKVKISPRSAILPSSR